MPGQAEGAAVSGEGVEVGVGGGVVALARGAEGGGGGGEEHERRQAQVRGEFVQVPGGVDLGAEDRVDAFGGEGGEHAVGEYTGRVDHGGQRPVGGQTGQHCGESVAVGGVAGDAGDLGTQLGQLADQGGVGAAPAEQQQVARAPVADQVAGDDPAEGAGRAGQQDGAGAEAAFGDRGIRCVGSRAVG